MPQDYVKRALEAEEQARRSETPEERKTFQEVAKLWRELAERKTAKSDRP